jgi:AAA15 family ATPase/GTPase
MKITRLELVNFKRFTHLTLEGIPEHAKLVLLVGANGSGKSSVFDAFECILLDTVFVGVKDALDVFLNVKRDNRYYSLRDRDFLSDTEIDRIQKRYPTHRILEYYDFENYIYHPDNITEVAPAGFDRQAYIEEITRQKNAKLLQIVAVLASSKNSYEEFKTDESLRDKDYDGVIADFESQEFERFYKFFDMKDRFVKTYIDRFNLSKSTLVSTRWFKAKINQVLGI